MLGHQCGGVARFLFGGLKSVFDLTQPFFLWLQSLDQADADPPATFVVNHQGTPCCETM